MGIGQYLRDGWSIVKFPKGEYRDDFVHFVTSLARDIKTWTASTAGLEAKSIPHGENVAAFRYQPNFAESAPDIIRYFKGFTLPLSAEHQ